jgi:hypothetical protein
MFKVLLASLFLFTGIAYADVNERSLPGINQHISQGVYQSSVTNGAFTGSGFVNISSPAGAATLYCVAVTSAGSADAVLEIFNGVSTNTANRLIDALNTSVVGNWIFNVHASSGISIFNRGTIPAKATIIYRKK